MKRAFDRVNEYKWSVPEEFGFQAFGKVLPPLYALFGNDKGVLVATDPEIVSDLYIAKNKYFDKTEKMRSIMGNGFIGDSILFSASDEAWAVKRKRLGAAFYKDKLNGLLKTIIWQANH